MIRQYAATAAVAVLLLAVLSTAEAQSPVTNVLFTNGNMQTFESAGASGSMPTGWVVSGGLATGAQSSTNSPFTNAYANNSSSFVVNDPAGADNGFAQYFSNPVTTKYQSISVNFDFMVPTLTSGLTAGAWGIQFDGDGGGAPGSSSVHYRIDRNGNFSINAGPTGSIQDIVALEANTWYNVQATFDVTAINNGSGNGAGVQSGAITKFGGATTTWSNVPTLNTTLGYSRLLIRDRSATVTGNLFVDNVSVVPEPSSALLALGGVGSLLALRFRRRAAA